jgi:MFS family permease
VHRDPPSSDEPSDAGRVATLVGLLFGLAGMGSAGVAVALPALAADLGLSTGGRAWVISVYALTLAVATAVYGGGSPTARSAGRRPARWWLGRCPRWSTRAR